MPVEFRLGLSLMQATLVNAKRLVTVSNLPYSSERQAVLWSEADWLEQLHWPGEVHMIKRFGTLYDKRVKTKQVTIRKAKG
jgi:hypothetical protein